MTLLVAIVLAGSLGVLSRVLAAGLERVLGVVVGVAVLMPGVVGGVVGGIVGGIVGGVLRGVVSGVVQGVASAFIRDVFSVINCVRGCDLKGVWRKVVMRAKRGRKEGVKVLN